MRWRYKFFVFALILISSLLATVLSNILIESRTMASVALLQAAPTQPVGYYDYFGKLLTPQQAANLVRTQGLDDNDPVSYQRVGAVEISQALAQNSKLT